MELQLEKNKAVVRRFNTEVIGQGNLLSYAELLDKDFINQTAAEGMDKGAEGIRYTFENLLRPAFPDMRVEIYEQVAEGDLVTTRKTIKGTHTGALLDIAPTGREVNINVIDIVRIRDGKYFEHWGINTLPVVMAQLRG